METVVEAGSREQKTEMRRRCNASVVKTACLIALAGYILLVLVFPEFIVALPLLELSLCLLGRVSVHRARRTNRSHHSGIAALGVDGNLPAFAREPST